MAPITKQFHRFSETDIDEEIIIMRHDNGEVLSLSETGATIWRLLDGTRNRADLGAAITDRFNIDERLIDPDIDEFLLQLREAGLIADS